MTMDPILERSFRGHKDVITSLAFKPSMTQLASGSMDHSVMVWNFKPQLRAFRFVGHKAAVTAVDFSPSGHLLASSSRDTTLIGMDFIHRKGDVTVFKAHTSTVRTVQFSTDGESLLTASDDKTIKLWSTHRTKFQYTLGGHLNWVRAAKFSPDSRLIVSGSDDKTVKLWDLSSKTCIKSYYDHTGMVTSVAFHPAGTIIASASTDRSIKLFDIRTHKLIQHYSNAHLLDSVSGNDGSWPSGGTPNSISFDQSRGDWLVSTGMDGLVKIWDLKEGHLFYTLHGHKFGPTTAAVFSPEADFFATGGSDSQIMVWRSNFDRTLKNIELGEKRAATSPNRHPPTRSDPFPRPSSKQQNHHEADAIISAKPVAVSNKKDGDMDSTRSNRPASRANRPRTPDAEIFNRFHAQGPSIVDVGGPVLDDGLREDGRYSREEGGEPITSQLEPRTIPEHLASTLQHIVRQIDVLTQTMTIFESRLSMNEDKIVEVSRTLASLTAAKNVAGGGNPNETKRYSADKRERPASAASMHNNYMTSTLQPTIAGVKPFGGHLASEYSQP
ncbi:POC1 centriolar protein A [Dinochytrium kinnereticum]|nr:POC1 centriolar protein A [Dinochytrium kinnereticum]